LKIVVGYTRKLGGEIYVNENKFECALGYHTIGIYACREKKSNNCFLVERCIYCGEVIEAAPFGLKTSLQKFVFGTLDVGTRIRDYILRGHRTLKQMSYALSSPDILRLFQNVEDFEFMRLDKLDEKEK
jgi:hypothetical protein